MKNFFTGIAIGFFTMAIAIILIAILDTDFTLYEDLSFVIRVFTMRITGCIPIGFCSL